MPRRGRDKKFMPGPIIRNEIRGRIESGETDRQIYDALRRRYPKVNANAIWPELRTVHRQISSVASMGRFNRGSFINIQKLAGCAPGQTVRIGFMVSWTDPDSGRINIRGVSVDIQGCTRWGECLDRGLAEVRRVQSRKGGQSPEVPPGNQLAGDANHHIWATYMECA